MKVSRETWAGRRRGLTLIECLVHIGLLGVLLSVGGFTVAKAWDQWRGLDHNAADIQRTLSLGERWRADIRAATGPITTQFEGTGQTVTIPTHRGEVTYQLHDGQLRRRVNRHAPWVVLYPAVAASRMEPFTRDGIGAWRWEIELKAGYKKVRLRPVFTFIAVPGREGAP